VSETKIINNIISTRNVAINQRLYARPIDTQHKKSLPESWEDTQRAIDIHRTDGRVLDESDYFNDC
jgi:hypothetical protein